MTIKQRLIELGMNENDFDNHYSDLYVRRNDWKWIRGIGFWFANKRLNKGE